MRGIYTMLKKNKKSVSQYHNVSRKDKYLFITEIFPEEKIKHLLENENHSFGMIKDLIQRDYLDENTKEIVKNIVCAKNHQAFSIILKENGLYFDLEKYNKMPQYWKIQYRFPKDWNIEQIKKEIHTASSLGQQITVEKRKVNGSYNNVIFDRKWSPLTVEFYTTKGYTEQYALERIKKICSNGAKQALKTTQKPSTEIKIESVLQEISKSYSTQFVIKNDTTLDNRKSFIYDFLLPETKTIIEVNGDFFHANPDMYNENDMIPLPSGAIKAKDIWEKDKRKIDFAIQKGYNVIVVWEHEINYRIDTIKDKLLNV
jgi:G:T-mismatch repair DNA endonuclease (very short patch repair protein)